MLWRCGTPAGSGYHFMKAIVMQAIGLVGETILLLTFPAGHTAVRATVRRFILFDGSGLLLLFLAAWLVLKEKIAIIKMHPAARGQTHALTGHGFRFWCAGPKRH